MADNFLQHQYYLAYVCVCYCNWYFISFDYFCSKPWNRVFPCPFVRSLYDVIVCLIASVLWSLYVESWLEATTLTLQLLGEIYRLLPLYVVMRASNCGVSQTWVAFAVVQAKNIPGMSTSDLSCPFVSVELCPLTMFPVTKPYRTPVRTSTVNPVYEEKFELWAFVIRSHLRLVK